MGKEINETLDWFAQGLKKYGLLVFLGVVIYQAIKRGWFWVAMPILFLITLRQIAAVANIVWVDKLSIGGLVVAWIFTFSMLKKLGALFVKEAKET